MRDQKPTHTNGSKSVSTSKVMTKSINDNLIQTNANNNNNSIVIERKSQVLVVNTHNHNEVANNNNTAAAAAKALPFIYIDEEGMFQLSSEA